MASVASACTIGWFSAPSSACRPVGISTARVVHRRFPARRVFISSTRAAYSGRSAPQAPLPSKPSMRSAPSGVTCGQVSAVVSRALPGAVRKRRVSGAMCSGAAAQRRMMREKPMPRARPIASPAFFPLPAYTIASGKRSAARANSASRSSTPSAESMALSISSSELMQPLSKSSCSARRMAWQGSIFMAAMNREPLHGAELSQMFATRKRRPHSAPAAP